MKKNFKEFMAYVSGVIAYASVIVAGIIYIYIGYTSATYIPGEDKGTLVPMYFYIAAVAVAVVLFMVKMALVANEGTFGDSTGIRIFNFFWMIILCAILTAGAVVIPFFIMFALLQF